MNIDDLFENFNQKDSVVIEEETTTLGKRARDVTVAGLLNKAKESKVTDEKIDLAEFCAVPDDYAAPSEKKPVKPPAKVYKFKLDEFQQKAVDHIENDDSVLVAAHTSAGKTAVAEYAIAKSFRDGQRVIYTSPIKALSNQKYRDLQEEFKDVGLMTGDMTINPNATCLVMTTEILRSMLYRGSEVIREVAWVIYDEVHYMRDKERGVVWEESIILLPHKVRYVFLSATIPNAQEFVTWVSKLHHHKCWVVYTDYRPVPLQHFVFPAGAEGLYLVVDEKNKFRDDNFQKAMSCLQIKNTEETANKTDKKQKKISKNIAGDLFKIVKLIMERELDPCIVFSFSKKDCESYALQMARLDFNAQEEKELVEQVFLNAIEALSEDDKTLPQVATILPLLKRGVGIHHGGLLPILKEVIEILFQEGLIKCLFATETFSIGINMPAKTVVFTQTRKYDGKDFRWITSGEYIQMSGRAGRRGKDDRGIVIQMMDEKVEPDIAKEMIWGKSDPLFSSYHVSYNMVLNMLRVEDANPENLLRASFFQYQQQQHVPELQQTSEQLYQEAVAIKIEHEKEVSEYVDWLKLLKTTEKEVNTLIMQPNICLPFIQSGRMCQIQYGDVVWGWGIIMNLRKLGPNDTEKSYMTDRYIGGVLRTNNNSTSHFIIDIMLEVCNQKEYEQAISDSNSNATPIEFPSHLKIRPYNNNNDNNNNKLNVTTQIDIVHVSLESIVSLSAVRLTMPKDFTKDKSRVNINKAIKEVLRRFEDKGGVPLLDPIKDMAVSTEIIQPFYDRKQDLLSRIEKSTIHTMKNKSTLLQQYETKMRLFEESELYKQKAKESQHVSMNDELKKMKKVLKKLEFITPEGVLCLKGRFSCELSTGDELVVASLVFEGVFNELSVDQTVALLSCFVHKEGAKESSGNSNNIRSDMQAPFRQLQTITRNIVKVCQDMKMTIDEEEYVNSFNPGLVDVAYAWSSGAKFVDICKLTDVFEGSIIRVLRRLEELLRQLAAASVAIGNNELNQLFEEGAKRIRRGVVFAASLYL